MFMKKNLLIIILISIMLTFFHTISFASDGELLLDSLTNEEIDWINNNKQNTIKVGIPFIENPIAYDEGKKGYSISILDIIFNDLNIKYEVVLDNWQNIYSMALDKELDIVIGMNKTKERERHFSFTKLIEYLDYFIYSRNETSIYSLDDINKSTKIGYISMDIAKERFDYIYKDINPIFISYDSADELYNGLINDDVDGVLMPDYFIMSSLSNIRKVAKLHSLATDIRYSTPKDNAKLTSILEKYIDYYYDKGILNNVISESVVDYSRIIINLTPEENITLSKIDKIEFYSVMNYPPFAIQDRSLEKVHGINDVLINRLCNVLDIEYTHKVINRSEVEDLLNSPKNKLQNIPIIVIGVDNNDITNKYSYSNTYYKSQFKAYGKPNRNTVSSIYDLEGLDIAVTDGMHFIDDINKSLSNVTIRETSDSYEAIKLATSGKVDYVIDDPHVFNYFINRHQITELISYGTVDYDVQYSMVSNNKNNSLIKIFNKILPIVDIDEVVKEGFSSIPRETILTNYQKTIITASLFVFVSSIVLIIFFKSQTQQYKTMLYTDHLTKLLSRNGLNRFINKRLSSILDKKEVYAIQIDIKNFKSINESYSDHVGDSFLRAFACLLIKTFPDTEISRIANDDFVIILYNNNKEEIIQKIKTIYDILTSKKLLTEPKVYANISVGITKINIGNYLKVLVELETCLKAIKKGYCEEFYMFYTDGLDKMVNDYNISYHEVINAIHRDYISIYFQPIIPIDKTKKPIVEALVRISHPKWGVLSPGKFLSCADETKLTPEIDVMVVEKTFKIYNNWLKDNFTPYVTINLSIDTLTSSTCINKIINKIKKYSIKPDMFLFEVNEQKFTLIDDVLIKNIQTLRSLGFRFAIDDFGTGYSSMHRLLKIFPEIIKTDKTFVNQLADNPKTHLPYSISQKISNILDVDVVIEGVEALEHLRTIKSIFSDCENKLYFQGYIFSKPKTPYSVRKYLMDKEYLPLLESI